MGKLSREKQIRKDTIYRKFFLEMKNERGVNYYKIGENETMALNPLKHIIKGVPYKNKECQKLLRQTLNQYKAYVNQMTEEVQEKLEG